LFLYKRILLIVQPFSLFCEKVCINSIEENFYT
jgi:hypothetical protein